MVKKTKEEVAAEIAEIPEVEEVRTIHHEHHIKIAIKSQQYKPRGRAGMYRAGGVYVVKASEAMELDRAGIAIIIGDPCGDPITVSDEAELD